MKQLPLGLQDHLNTGTTTLCWCWRVTRQDGLVQGFTDHDKDLEFDGTNYKASTGFSGTELKDSIGLNVDNIDVDGAFKSESLTETDLSKGLYDNATVELFRVNWQNTDQRILMRTGSIGEVTRSEYAFRAEIRGLAHHLQQPKGRLYQFTCDADLGDGRCNVNLNQPAFQATGSISAILNNRSFVVSGLETYEDDWFTRGVIRITSGSLLDQKQEVKSHSKLGSVISIELWQPFIGTMEAGSTFEITAGCDKHFTTCKSKFSNGLNFRGFPHIPGNDYIMSYPNKEDGNHNGQSRQ